MANRRMFNLSVIGTDAFMEMPDSAQNLYFYLSMYADDDGFVDKWKQIMRMTGKKEDDLKLLIAKSFILPFENGVIVIRHWKLNNYIRTDRYTETIYKNEKSLLSEEENGTYNFGIPNGSQVVYQLDTQYSIDKNSIDKNNINNVNTEKIKQIIDYLNSTLGTQYKATSKETRKHINARLEEGYTLEQFKEVINKKSAQWIGTEYEQYLRPSTLFGTKFESYLNASVPKPQEQQTQTDSWADFIKNNKE